MKKKWIVAALAVCAIVLAGCKVVSEPEPIAVKSVTLDAEKFTLAPGATKKLIATVTPDNAEDKTVKWASSDTAVATVDGGTVKAIKEGTATITAQAGGKTAICVVTVNEVAVVNPDSPIVNPDSPVAVESVTLNAETLTIAPGATKKLQATVMPSNADDKAVTWLSSDTTVATVDSDGTVTANAEGAATITAQVGGKTAMCIVTVKPILNPVENITISETTLTLKRGETGILRATVTPDNADDLSVIWWSSDPSVANVGNDGAITAVGEGTATIVANTREGSKTATCTVTVLPNPITVESVMFNTTELTLVPGSTGNLTVTVMPGNVDDKTVEWSSDNESVAAVDNDGTVTAYMVGTATITAKVGGKEAACKVTVTVCVHFYSGAYCMKCGLQKPTLEGATINEYGMLTKYNGSAANVVIPDGVTEIGIKAFRECTSLKSVVIPEGVTEIGYDAFYGCMSLTSVIIPDSVTIIKENAFCRCPKLTSVIIPEGVTEIGGSAFWECTLLESITIPMSVTNIGIAAFVHCTSLESVVIPGSVTSIGSSTFNGCTSLKSVTLPDSVTSIGNQAFYNCTGLKSVTIPDGVTEIGESAFYGCTSLKNVTIPDSVTSIGNQAFLNSNVLSINYGGTKEQWKKIEVIDNIVFLINTKIHCKDGDITYN